MDTELQQFKKLLGEQGHYITKARVRLFALLQKHPALSMKDLITLLPRHDQATVYRNVAIFEQLGIIARLQFGRQAKLELSDMFRHHHHHLTCIKCGHIVGLPENSVLENEITKLARHENFKPIDHQLEIRGICTNCRVAAL